MPNFNEDILISFYFTYTNYEKVQLRPKKNTETNLNFYMPNLTRGSALSFCWLWSLFFNRPTTDKTQNTGATGRAGIDIVDFLLHMCLLHSPSGLGAPKWWVRMGIVVMDSKHSLVGHLCVFLCWLNKKGVICWIFGTPPKKNREVPKSLNQTYLRD